MTMVDILDLGLIFNAQGDQEAGTWFHLLHPLSGEPIGVRVKVAGPDSKIQNAARHEMEDAMIEATRRVSKYRKEGIAPASEREEIAIKMLARCIVDIEAMEGGKPMRLSLENAEKIIRIGSWARAQIDAFAADYRPYYPVETKAAEPKDEADAEG